MGKQIFWNGKRVKLAQLSDGEVMLNVLLNQEKKLTARWYSKISGAVPWNDGEREALNSAMDELAMQVDHRIGRIELHKSEISNCFHV